MLLIQPHEIEISLLFSANHTVVLVSSLPFSKAVCCQAFWPMLGWPSSKSILQLFFLACWRSADFFGWICKLAFWALSICLSFDYIFPQKIEQGSFCPPLDCGQKWQATWSKIREICQKGIHQHFRRQLLPFDQFLRRDHLAPKTRKLNPRSSCICVHGFYYKSNLKPLRIYLTCCKKCECFHSRWSPARRMSLNLKMMSHG